MSRRHVLGDYYSRCEAIVSVPVYLESSKGEMLGYADQGLGHYADAFSFHVPDDVCKKLSAGYFTYSFEFNYSERKAAPGRFRRVKISSISLIPRQNYEKPLPRRGAHAEEKVAAVDPSVDGQVV
jgi:hypothetical protein